MGEIIELSDCSTEESSTPYEFLVCTEPRENLESLYQSIEELSKVHTGGMLLYTNDLRRLHPHKWLNDKIVNSYCGLLVDHFPCAYAFSSYLYSSMLSKPIQEIKEWFCDVDLFGYEYLIVPLNSGLHWTLVIVNHYDIEYYDSMGSFDPRASLAIRTLLRTIHTEVRGTPGNYAIFNMSKSIPLQENTDDCGVFCCMLARFRIDSSCTKFFQPGMAFLLRQRMLHELLAGQIIYQYG